MIIPEHLKEEAHLYFQDETDDFIPWVYKREYGGFIYLIFVYHEFVVKNEETFYYRCFQITNDIEFMNIHAKMLL